MSSTNRGGDRANLDFYETPAWATRAILPHLLPLPDNARILDPGCGTGAIMREVLVASHHAGCSGGDGVSRLVGVELDEERARHASEALGGILVVGGDFLAFTDRGWDLVIANPPYAMAREFIEHAIDIADGGTVAMLLRLAFVAGKGRRPFWARHPGDVYVLAQRPSFCVSVSCSAKRGGCDWHCSLQPSDPIPPTCPKCGAKSATSSVDSADYAWMVWGRGRGGKWTRLETT